MLRIGEKVFAQRIEIADTFIKRLLGLMGRTKLDQEGGIILTPCTGIHTLWMSFPIDCLYLDGDHRVIHMETIEPWRIGKIIKGCKTVIELPKGTIERLNIKLNQKIILKEEK
ncbi:DUF192 domain-containing protein [Thermotalea metallivorans]|uniref:DUF192 domain-containing protein n=1 Tax=Thermotalea metallivorans TaxID=520762 RepID=A0A140L9Y3_9FIRM|nr:DUF192 domain-containing protein [Thermotalea metallivorans]KXG77358.1 hypothetical protein AN619_04840 [Thermotalea metallivorans]